MPVVELPLVVMDVALDHLRRTGRDWRLSLQDALRGIAHAGVGGATILWHDAVFRGAQIDPEVAEAYWTACEALGTISTADADGGDRPPAPRGVPGGPLAVGQPARRSTEWNRYG